VALKRQGATPKEIVLSAYDAAGHGHFAKANALLAPAFRKGLAETQAVLVANDKGLRRTLLRLKRRRGEIAARDRRTVRALIRANRAFIRMQIQSPRFLSGLWKAFTQGRSVVRVEATRQVIRVSRARVYLRLTLRDGSVVRDRETLVLHRGRWFLG
jgi:hypothetical protein